MPRSGGGDSVSRNAAFGLGAQIATSAFTAALTLYLVRALGPTGYGTFALAVGISIILGLPADFGVSQSAGRFVAERLDNHADVGSVLAMAVRLKLAIAALVSVGLFALAGPISLSYGAPDLIWPLRAIAIAMFGQSMMQLARVVFAATRRMSRTFTLVAAESAMEFSASVALVLLGAGASGAAFGRALGYLFGAALGLLLISRLIGVPVWRTGSRSPVAPRQFIAYAGTLLIIDGAFALFTQIDVLIIGALLGATSIGLFGAPMRLVDFLAFPGLAVAQSVAPRLAGRGAIRRSEVERLAGALRLMMLLQAVPTLFALAWATPIVNLLFGSGYEDSAAVLRGLAPFIFMVGLGPLATLTLNYAGEAGKRVPIAILAVAVNAGFDLAFVPVVGVLAGAIGTSIGYGTYVAGHLLVCRTSLGLPLRPLFITFLRTAVAAVPVAALLLGLASGGLSPWTWAVGLVAGPAVMTAALRLIGEISGPEITQLARLPGRFLLRR